MASIRSFVLGHPLVSYFALTFAISWGALVPGLFAFAKKMSVLLSGVLEGVDTDAPPFVNSGKDRPDGTHRSLPSLLGECQPSVSPNRSS